MGHEQLTEEEKVTMARIFISHAVKDEELVEEFVDFLDVGIGIEPSDVFCSSLPGMNIPTGEGFVDYIKSKVSNPELVILVLTTDYLNSQFCNNEVGASWALDIAVYPLLVPPLRYGDVKGVLAGLQISKLNDKEKLNDLRDDLNEKFGLKSLRTSHWERRRDKFLGKLEKLATSPTGKTATPPIQKPLSASLLGAVNSSGTLLKLGDHFYETTSFERRGSSEVRVSILPSSSADEASLSRLRPDPNGFRRKQELTFAYQNEGSFATVEKVVSRTVDEKNIWELDLVNLPRNSDLIAGSGITINGNNFPAEDIAEMKATRILFEDPPKRKRSDRTGGSIESWAFGEDRKGVSTKECVLRNYVETHGISEDSLKKARLECVFTICAGLVADHILDLEFTPTPEGHIAVVFRGQRSAGHTDAPLESIGVEGVCKIKRATL